MAKLHEEVLVVKLSKLLRDGEVQEVILNDQLKATIELLLDQILEEAAGSKLLIEISKGEEE